MSLKTKRFPFFICLVLAACGSRTRLEDRHGLVPSAVGDVITKSNEDGETKMKIVVKHLDKPQEHMPDANNYIVWIQPKGYDTFENIGTLRVAPTQEGEFQTTVPWRNFHVMITPEFSNDVTNPKGPAVFEKDISL